MIQRLQRATVAWPKIPGRRVDLHWRDRRLGDVPGPLDRTLRG